MTPERREEIAAVVERWRLVGEREGRSLMLVELWDELMAREEASMALFDDGHCVCYPPRLLDEPHTKKCARLRDALGLAEEEQTT